MVVVVFLSPDEDAAEATAALLSRIMDPEALDAIFFPSIVKWETAVLFMLTLNFFRSRELDIASPASLMAATTSVDDADGYEQDISVVQTKVSGMACFEHRAHRGCPGQGRRV